MLVMVADRTSRAGLVVTHEKRRAPPSAVVVAAGASSPRPQIATAPAAAIAQAKVPQTTHPDFF
jgi:hypothetical protein